MNENVKDFLSEVTTLLKRHFKEFNIEVLIETQKSLKTNIHLAQNLFIAVRYNSRNERMDFALIYNDKRIFGYDNLKEWHCHPYENPSDHIPCDKPSIEKIIIDIKRIYEVVKNHAYSER